MPLRDYQSRRGVIQPRSVAALLTLLARTLPDAGSR